MSSCGSIYANNKQAQAGISFSVSSHRRPCSGNSQQLSPSRTHRCCCPSCTAGAVVTRSRGHESMHGCTSKAQGDGESFPEIREEKKETWCYPRKYFKTCTPHTAQWLPYKSKTIIRQKSNLSLGAVIGLLLLSPAVSCRGTVVQAYCVLGEYSPLRLQVRCQLRHSNLLQVIIESHIMSSSMNLPRTPHMSAMTSVLSNQF